MRVASRSTGSQAFAARARRRRLRRLLGMLLAVIVALGVGTLVWLVGWSSVLAVKDAEVQGVRGALADDVLEAARAPIGTPLARVDTGAVASRVQELPDIEDVDVHRSWPNTLTIDVTPRVAEAAMQADGAWFGVDRSGMMFARSEAKPENLPVLEASSDDADQQVRAAGVAVLTGLPTDVLEQVESVHAHSEADIRLALGDDVMVELGTADDLDRKAEVLLALMQAQDETPSVYDVSAPNHPAVTQ